MSLEKNSDSENHSGRISPITLKKAPSYKKAPPPFRGKSAKRGGFLIWITSEAENFIGVLSSFRCRNRSEMVQKRVSGRLGARRGQKFSPAALKLV